MLRRWRPVGSGVGVDRITAFSDGVIAIAITLLVLQLNLPSIPNDRVTAELPHVLRDLLPKMGSYALSFFLIGMFWAVHHRLFSFIRRYDARLVQMNLLFLFCISFLPFTTELNGAYGSDALGFTVYAVNLAATGLTITALWVYATWRHRHVDPALDDRLILFITLRGLIIPITAALGVAIAWLGFVNANYVWFALAIFPRILHTFFQPEQEEADRATFDPAPPAPPDT